jgi:two-component system LytT family response regulator
MEKIRTVIIDDEPHGRLALKNALEKFCPQVKIEGICSDPEEAIEAIRKVHPDLVFLDVQMPVMSGFDLLQALMPVSFEVIFITAYDHYAIKAIKFSALDYLLKPLDVDELIHAVEKVKSRRQDAGNSYRYQSVLNNIYQEYGKIEKLAVPSSEGIDFYNTKDIIYCKADGHYTTLYMKNKRRELITRNLKDIENMLVNSGFCRVHNSYLINLRHVKKYIRGEGGYVILLEDHHVDISRRKKDEFLKMLEKI